MQSAVMDHPRLVVVEVFIVVFVPLLFLAPHTAAFSLSEEEANKAPVRNFGCVTDFVSTISCSFSAETPQDPAANGSAYTLLFLWDNRDLEYECVMSHAGDGNYSCTVDVNGGRHHDDEDAEIFMDLDVFAIFLCHAEQLHLLDEEFELKRNIRPLPPRRLVVHNASCYVLSWESGYEGLLPFYDKAYFLSYQLRYYQLGQWQGAEAMPGHAHPGNVTLLSAVRTNVTLAALAPDVAYVAAVRSIPNQGLHGGTWSSWSAEVQWRTRPSVPGAPKPPVPAVDMRVLLPVCVLAPLLLLVCCAPVRRWKRSSFIPTPAPYFQTLYRDHQGDFKSWVVTPGKRTDVLEAQEALHIDTLTECVELPSEERPLQDTYEVIVGCPYSNLSSLDGCVSASGLPYALSTGAASCQSRTTAACLLPGSPAGDSGCCLGSDSSLERDDAPWHRDAYCTLKAFQTSQGAAREPADI